MKTLRALLFFCASLAIFCLTAKATPYASCFSNNLDGSMSFYLNESGGDVTITYDDDTTDALYNGVTTGTNLALGQYTFTLGTHTNYTISVHKVGSGIPSLISSQGFTPRGVAVNTRPGSPYFGRIYADISGGNINVMNPDLSLTYGGSRSAGIAWAGGGRSPYRLSVTPDDYLMVGDISSAHAGVYRIDPTVTTGAPVFGPTNEAAGLAAGVFGTIQSRPLILGDPSTGPFALLQVDGDYDLNGTPYTSLLVYSNMTLATLPWTNVPDFIGPAIGVNFNSELLGDNEYPGLVQGPHNYVYASTYRNNLSNPLIQIYDPANSYTQVWNSQENAPASGDFFLTTGGNGATQGIIDCTVSPDGGWLVGASIDNWFVITPLLPSGIPDTTKLFISTPTSYSGNGRGVTMDIADNIYLASSGIGAVQSWTLGLTTTAITAGNTNGATGFSLIEPSNSVTVVATTPIASQGGANGTIGTPTPGVFTLTRLNAQNDYSSAFTVNYTLSGTATNGTYTVAASGTPVTTNSVTFAPGQATTNIYIFPSTANIPRPTTTVVLSINAGADYLASTPRTDTVFIQNTSSNEFNVTSQTIPMYKGLSNDYAFATITRFGDTNSTVTIPAAAFTYTGSAVSGVDFTAATDLTFHPGDITLKAKLFPLINGDPSVHTNEPIYTGNKNGTITLNASTGYGVSASNSSSFTIVDDAYVPGPVTVYSDPLTQLSDAANWNITFGSGDPANQNSSDYDVEFGYDLVNFNATFGQIGLPPSGATTCLRVTCNRSNPFAEAGVNVYLTNKLFAGNYAVRFSMNIVQDSSTANDVAGPIFGINHNGLETNWFADNLTDVGSQPFWASDGVWYFVDETPGGVTDDFQEYTGDGSPATNQGWTQIAATPASTFANVYKNPTVFTATNGAASGVPANISTYLAPDVAADGNWSDVEIKQVQNVVTMSIDHTPVFTYANTTMFTNGFLMLGYETPMTGAQHDYAYTPEAGVYYSNLKVVEISPMITVQPVPLIVAQGSPATFTATAAFGTAPYTNVWFFGTNTVFTNVVSTATDDAVYTIASATPLNEGSYSLVVSDAAGSITSSPATLAVIVPPVVTNSGPAITTNWHVNVSMPAGISGTGLTYAWYFPSSVLTNGGRISGATTGVLMIDNLQLSDTGTYGVVATNIAGGATNNFFLIVVKPPPPQFTDLTLSGTNASFAFTSTDIYDTTNSFTLQSSTNVAGPYVNVSTTVTGGSDSFQITIPQNGPVEFYRIIHQ